MYIILFIFVVYVILFTFGNDGKADSDVYNNMKEDMTRQTNIVIVLFMLL